MVVGETTTSVTWEKNYITAGHAESIFFVTGTLNEIRYNFIVADSTNAVYLQSPNASVSEMNFHDNLVLINQDPYGGQFTYTTSSIFSTSSNTFLKSTTGLCDFGDTWFMAERNFSDWKNNGKGKWLEIEVDMM